MKINVHYEVHNPYGETLCWVHSMDMLFYSLQSKYPEYEFNKIHWWSGNNKYLSETTDLYFDKFKHVKTTSMLMLIENSDNGNYFVISYWDKGYYEIKSFSDYEEKCKGIFSSNGMHLDDLRYTPAPIGYTPISHMGCFKSTEKTIDELYFNNLKNDQRITPNKLNFRCVVPYLFRKYLLENDDRFEINTEYLDPIIFLEEMSKYKINMDINGVSEPTCRIAQVLGLGSVLIRPKLNVKSHNELIGDYHYAEVECEDLGDYKLLSDAYIDKFEKIKNDKDYLDFISKNGRKYYEENCTIESHVKIVTDLIDLKKLK